MSNIVASRNNTKPDRRKVRFAQHFAMMIEQYEMSTSKIMSHKHKRNMVIVSSSLLDDITFLTVTYVDEILKVHIPFVFTMSCMLSKVLPIVAA